MVKKHKVSLKMDKFRLKIEYTNCSLGSRSNLLLLVARFNIPVTKIVRNTGCHMLYLFDAPDNEKVFREDMTAALKTAPYTAVILAELIPSYTVHLCEKFQIS